MFGGRKWWASGEGFCGNTSPFPQALGGQAAAQRLKLTGMCWKLEKPTLYRRFTWPVSRAK